MSVCVCMRATRGIIISAHFNCIVYVCSAHVIDAVAVKIGNVDKSGFRAKQTFEFGAGSLRLKQTKVLIFLLFCFILPSFIVVSFLTCIVNEKTMCVVVRESSIRCFA